MINTIVADDQGITLLLAWGYDPLQPGDQRGS